MKHVERIYLGDSCDFPERRASIVALMAKALYQFLRDQGSLREHEPESTDLDSE